MWLDPALSFPRASPSALRPAPSNSAPELSQAGSTRLLLRCLRPLDSKPPWPWSSSNSPLRAFPSSPSPSQGPAPCCTSRVNHIQDQPRFSPPLPSLSPHLLHGMVAGTAGLAKGQTGARAHVERGEGATAHRQQCHRFIIRPSDDRTDSTCHQTRPARA